MNKPNPPDIYLDIQSTKFSKDINDPYDANPFFNKYLYDVYMYPDNSFDDNPAFIGKGRAYLYMFMKSIMDGYDIMDAFDENGQREYWKVMFDGDSISKTIDLKQCWLNIIEETYGIPDNILIQDRLEILPEFRNKHYGQIILNSLRDFFTGCYCIEIIKAFPLQLEDPRISERAGDFAIQMKFEELETDERKAFRKLKNYYRSCGFKQINHSNFFYHLPDSI